jgi:hypothetical protein
MGSPGVPSMVALVKVRGMDFPFVCWVGDEKPGRYKGQEQGPK